MDYTGRITVKLFVCSYLVVGALCCPDRCICYRSSRVSVWCQSLGFTHFPRDVPIDTYFLDLQNNDIREIKRTDLSNLTSLVRLNLNTISLATIKPGTFHGLDRLEYLFLMNNKLSTVEKDTFASLPFALSCSTRFRSQHH